MVILKLFLENFDPTVGKLSYVVEDERGDRVARAEITSTTLTDYQPTTMDLFILSFLPRLKEIGASLKVQGPMSHALKTLVGEDVSSDIIVEGRRQYTKEDIDVFIKEFKETRDTSKTLVKVFNYFE